MPIRSTRLRGSPPPRSPLGAMLSAILTPRDRTPFHCAKTRRLVGEHGAQFQMGTMIGRKISGHSTDTALPAGAAFPACPSKDSLTVGFRTDGVGSRDGRARVGARRPEGPRPAQENEGEWCGPTPRAGPRPDQSRKIVSAPRLNRDATGRGDQPGPRSGCALKTPRGEPSGRPTLERRADAPNHTVADRPSRAGGVTDRGAGSGERR
jgi:hypothetical protein